MEQTSVIRAEWTSGLCDCPNAACRSGDAWSAVLSCLFPCWLHGWIVSETEHEDPMPGCQRIGRKGCATCLALGVGHLVLWPVSPSTILYTCWERRWISQLYGIQPRNCCSPALAACCAPCALYQHVKLLEHEKVRPQVLCCFAIFPLRVLITNLLSCLQQYETVRFAWEKGDVDTLPLKPPSFTMKALLLGDFEVGKTTLFHWYLGQYVTTSEDNSRGELQCSHPKLAPLKSVADVNARETNQSQLEHERYTVMKPGLCSSRYALVTLVVPVPCAHDAPAKYSCGTFRQTDRSISLTQRSPVIRCCFYCLIRWFAIHSSRCRRHILTPSRRTQQTTNTMRRWQQS